jgi:hypothetical protein
METLGLYYQGSLRAHENLERKSSDLDGYNDPRPDDKARVEKAWEDGHVANEDAPDSARDSGTGHHDEVQEKPSESDIITRKLESLPLPDDPNWDEEPGVTLQNNMASLNLMDGPENEPGVATAPSSGMSSKSEDNSRESSEYSSWFLIVHS